MITGLIGINGSGKTTRLKNLYAQHAPGAAQFVPDNPIIPIEVSAHELLHRLGRMHQLPRAEAKRRATILCDELAIDGGTTRAISTYSAGNYKKTALAIVFIKPARHLYLDEPLEMVDAISRARILRILRRISNLGHQVTISTQDFTIAEQCDAIEVMADLEVVAEGAPRAVLGDDPFARLMELSGAEFTDCQADWLDDPGGVNTEVGPGLGPQAGSKASPAAGSAADGRGE